MDCCPREDITAYIDGELAPRAELDLEMHMAGCAICAEELNQQKTFLTALNFTLEKENEVELPKDFTKIIVANAESRVSGLRRSNELFNAIFICGALFLFVLFGLGSETGGVFNNVESFSEQAFAVIGFAGHIFYNFIIGTVLILKSLSSQLVFDSTPTFLLLGGVFLCSLIAFSRLMLRFNRAS